MSSVHIPESIDQVGQYAFSHCDGLHEVYISEKNLKSLHDSYVPFGYRGTYKKLFINRGDGSTYTEYFNDVHYIEYPLNHPRPR